MKKKLITSILCLLPLIAYAEVKIHNNTDAYGTGKIKNGACSSTLGDSGVMNPHGSMTLSKLEIISLCGFKTCEAYIYMSKDCSGNKLATVSLNVDGVKNILNHQPDQFSIWGGGSSMTIDAKKYGLFDWLKSLF